MKVLIFAKGPGESSHAYAIAKYLIKNKLKVIIALRQKVNLEFFHQLIDKNIFVTSTLNELTQLITSQKPYKVILCNSKPFIKDRTFILHSPWPSIETYTVDSNWLFEESSIFPYIKWAKKYLITMPKEVFELGLKKNKGHFNIPQKILKKIIPIGFIPSFKKSKKDITPLLKELNINIYKNEKTIFCYFSGSGAGGKFWVLKNLIKALEPINFKKAKIKILSVGNIKDNPDLPKFPWLIHLPNDKLNFEKFFQILSHSDLVFQHQGLATLSQAISSETPVICNVYLKSSKNYFGLHKYEVEPFARLNLCRLLYKTSPVQTIRKNILELLFNPKERAKMINSQKRIYSSGEKKLLESISQ